MNAQQCFIFRWTSTVLETDESKNGRQESELGRGGRNRLIKIKKRFLSQSAESKQLFLESQDPEASAVYE